MLTIELTKSNGNKGKKMLCPIGVWKLKFKDLVLLQREPKVKNNKNKNIPKLNLPKRKVA